MSVIDRQSLLSRIIDWIKQKLGLLTSSELLEYRKDLEYPWLYEQKFLVGNTVEGKILKEVFEQISEEKKTRQRLTFGMKALFKTSDVFNQIVKASMKQSIDESWRDVNRFKQISFGRIVYACCEREKEILQSLSKLDDFSVRMCSIKLSEGYSVEQVWQEFFSYIERLSKSLRLFNEI